MGSRSRSREPRRSRTRTRSLTWSRSKSRSRSRGRSPVRRSSSPEEEGYRVHVADLGLDCDRREVESKFKKFGSLIEVWVARNPPCFAFVVYKYQEDAEEAISQMNGKTLCGTRIRVSMARPRTRGRRRKGFDPNLRCYQCGLRGHFSRDCEESFSYRTAFRSRSRSPSPYRRRNDRRRSRSRSRSPRRSPERRKSDDRRRSDEKKSSRSDRKNTENDSKRKTSDSDGKRSSRRDEKSDSRREDRSDSKKDEKSSSKVEERADSRTDDQKKSPQKSYEEKDQSISPDSR